MTTTIETEQKKDVAISIHKRNDDHIVVHNIPAGKVYAGFRKVKWEIHGDASVTVYKVDCNSTSEVERHVKRLENKSKSGKVAASALLKQMNLLKGGGEASTNNKQQNETSIVKHSRHSHEAIVVEASTGDWKYFRRSAPKIDIEIEIVYEEDDKKKRKISRSYFLVMAIIVVALALVCCFLAWRLWKDQGNNFIYENDVYSLLCHASVFVSKSIEDFVETFGYYY